MSAQPDRERLIDLMVAHATEGIPGKDQRLMQSLARRYPDLDAGSFERAAAALDLVFTAGRDPTPLPDALRIKLRNQADAWQARRERPPRLGPGWIAWSGLAAASILVAVSAWWPRFNAGVPSPDTRMTALVAEASDLTRARWTPAAEDLLPGATGEVVWSDRRQEGFMRLRGLPANVPSKEQYQLWIVDAKRDVHPVDGGVFDVPAGATEVVVPIDAKLRLERPSAFVITLEQPGGVVVSDGPFLLVAKT